MLPARPAPRPATPTLALTHWGDVLEDYLVPAGLTFANFCDEMTGGYMFGYVEALRRAGVSTVLVVVSRSVTSATERTHRPSGTPIVVLPSPRVYRALRSRAVPWKEPLGDTPPEAATAISRGIERNSVKHLGGYLATPLLALGRTLRRHGCDALLCQEYEYSRFDASVALGRLMRVPVFATFQGAQPGGPPLERLARRSAVRRAHGLIVVTGTEADRVARVYGAPPPAMAQIPNPLDSGAWRPRVRATARAELGIPPEAEVVVWHGRIMIWNKGLDVLLEAWQQVRRARPDRDLRLHLVGTGADAPALRALLDTDAGHGVHWRDEYVLDRDFMRTHLSAGDVAVMPSRLEGQPVAPLEAMACGLPLVAACASGMPDILEEGEGHGGILVPCDDADALAEGLGRLLDDPEERRLMGERARRRVETAFSLDAVGRRLRDFMFAAAPRREG